MNSNRKTATVLRLVPRASTPPSNRDHDETLHAVGQLFDLARNSDDEMVGIAFIRVHESGKVVVDAAGKCYRCPDDTRGMLAQLHDALGKLARGEEMPPGW